MGSMPRRARQQTPAGRTPRGRVTAACAVLILLAHLLLAQLTLGLAVAFTVTGRVSRWRMWWLTGPALAGLAWALAIGAGRAGAGFAAGPAHVLGYLGRGRLAAGLGHRSGPFAGAGGWLPRQLPIALIAGAAEAALIGWLEWLRADERAVRPRRPGAVAATRTALAASLIRSGSVVTRDGCALGVAPATGAVAELRWPEIAGGVLVAGAERQGVTVTGLQVVHAALRRRKPLIVIDASADADAAIARALAAACAATGTPLRHERAGLDLGPVIGERSAALLRVGSAELAARACASVAALAASLGRIGVDGDGLIWVTGGERLPAQAVARLIGDGRAAGLGVLIGTSSPVAAAELARLVDALLILRIGDPRLAATLAASACGEPGVGGQPGAGGEPGVGGEPGPSGRAGRTGVRPAPGAVGQRPAVARAGRVRAGGERAATPAGRNWGGWCRPGSRAPPPCVRSARGGGCAMTPHDPDGPLYLGWEYATPCQDPGPPPRRPAPQPRPPMSADWLAAQRREERLINRPLKIIVAVAAGIALALGGCVAGGLLRAIVAAPTIAVLLLAAALAGYAIWQGERVLRGRVAAERAAGRAVAGGPGDAGTSPGRPSTPGWSASGSASGPPSRRRNAGTACPSRRASIGWTSPGARFPAGRHC